MKTPRHPRGGCPVLSVPDHGLRTGCAPGPAPRPAAFTLIEVMVALTILGFLLTAVYSSWSAVVRASKIGLDAASRVQHTRIAIRTIVDSLLTVQMFGGNANLYAFVADTKGDYASVSFVSRLPASFPDAGLFGDKIVRRVTFSVEPGPQGNQLVMYQMPLLAKENAEQKPFPIVLATDISLFTVEFWEGRGSKWLSDWDNTNALPKMVRVSLGLGRARQFSSHPEEVYTRIISMASMVIPREFQMGTPVPRTGPGGVIPPAGVQPANPGGTPLSPGSGSIKIGG